MIENTIQIKPETTDILAFCNEFTSNKNYLKHNLIVDFLEVNDLSSIEIKQLARLALTYQKQNLSFVMVVKNVDFNSLPETLNIAPTLEEANDIIQMEAIERDLM